MAPVEIALAAREAACALVAELSPAGHWRGELSSSALSTATAITALAQVDPVENAAWIAGGATWLAAHANGDGGWGDTVLSRSNISTTALCWAALTYAAESPAAAWAADRAEAWLAHASGSPGGRIEVPRLVRAIEQRYGRDRTFSVPILMMCALSGRLGTGGWRHVQPLPFELAALPHRFFAALRLPVVSYALPALIAIGQVIHHHAPTRNPLTRTARDLVKQRTLRKLTTLQPPNGGFLEATPLTSFVTMSLAAMDQREHLVTQRGVAFLRTAVRADGSWPIDTDLATWLTTLSLKALSHHAPLLSVEQRLTLKEWLLRQQYRTVHPYTQAAPGGWAWTDLPGGVPDADDTAGALLALLALGPVDEATRAAGESGVHWLLALQNGDGGVPTFCRGWGTLPFDQSSPDLTAHALRAWTAWDLQLSPPTRRRVARALPRALRFLQKTRRPEGCWVPLWFGNEHAPQEENPVYGTAQVLLALREVRARGYAVPLEMETTATTWLAAQQGTDGGWGGRHGAPASLEETGLAVEALAGSVHGSEVDRGAAWLAAELSRTQQKPPPAPIGFYFAKLWYYERLYPLIFATAGLGRAAALA